MNFYNGFSPAQRYKALAYHKSQIKLGIKPKSPQKCDGCGTEQGFLAWHSEDYSEPFGKHIGQYGVCYRCHMHIHCRFKNPKSFMEYAFTLKKNKRYKPYYSSNWKLFLHENLKSVIIGHIEEINNYDVTNSLILKIAHKI